MHIIFTLLSIPQFCHVCVYSRRCIKGFGYEVVCTIHKHAGFECADTVSSNKNILRMQCRCPQDTALTLQAPLERQKLKFYFVPEKLLYFLMFITAVCFLFLLKLRWPKPTSIYDFKINVLFPSDVS